MRGNAERTGLRDHNTSRNFARKRTVAPAANMCFGNLPLCATHSDISSTPIFVTGHGCLVLDDKGDGFVALVQANVVDLNDGWYRDCNKHVVDDSDDLNAVVPSVLGADISQTTSIEPEAIRQLRILARKMFGEVADEQPILVCARQYKNQGLVFVGRGEDIHLFLRSETVRKKLEITDWTQRGYTARNRQSSYFNFIFWDIEVELGAWDEMIAMYLDGDARTLATVQPLGQFEREKQLGEEIPDANAQKQ